MQQDIPMPPAWMCGLSWAELPEGATVPASCPACEGATGTHTPPAAGHAPNAGISYPGGDAVADERRTGWRQGVAASWQALRGDVSKPAPCRGCLTILEALGNRGPDGGGT